MPLREGINPEYALPSGAKRSRTQASRYLNPLLGCSNKNYSESMESTSKEEVSEYGGSTINTRTTGRVQEGSQSYCATSSGRSQPTKEMLKQENQNLKEQLKEERNRYSRAERSMLERVNKSTYHELPDNVMRDQFQELTNRCNEWTKTWNAENLSRVDDEVLRIKLLALLPRFDDPLPKALLAQARREERKFCRIILLSSLFESLVNDVFLEPFTSWDVFYPSLPTTCLTDFYHLLEKGTRDIALL